MKRAKSGAGHTRVTRREGASKTARGGGTTGRERSSPDAPPLEAALRAWRTTEAKKRRVPAFRILTDRTLIGIVHAHPKDESERLDVSGIGPALLGKYGRALLSIVAAPHDAPSSIPIATNSAKLTYVSAPSASLATRTATAWLGT
jgi:DNA topoisomerase-3